MNSLWDDTEAAAWQARSGALGLRVYTSRLLGRDRSLVLAGGGNTSVKVEEPNLFGEPEEVLYVKGSGRDLETIDEEGFTPLRRRAVQRLVELEELSDPRMVDELAAQRTRATAPAPSVEAILHASLPYTFVDHTHADAVLAVINTPGGEERVRAVWGDQVVVIPYVMPGFGLARLCAQQFAAEAGAQTIGMVLLHHGIFSFGATARESYERMIHLVTQAEGYLAAHGAWELPAVPDAVEPPAWSRAEACALAALRRDVSREAGHPMLLLARRDARSFAFLRRPDVAALTRQGPVTPDHVVRTKRVPLLGRDVAAYARAYRASFAALAPRLPAPRTMLDPAPRVILDPELGLLAAGRRASAAATVAEIYEHTRDVIERAERLGGWRALPEHDVFDVEYWDQEQAKLKEGPPPPFAGEVALVTGAASGIGKACVASLLARGAAVVGLDRDPGVASLHVRPDYRGLVCDVTDEAALCRAVATVVETYGGLDLLILNAGIFPSSRKLADLPSAEWSKVLAVNLDANQVLLRECHPFLALAPGQGRVVVIGSKNVPAPGPGAGAYSASKAALTQLVRVAALEWGQDGIRVNALHPNAVFDTGVWTDEVLAARAAAYGLDVEGYKKNNVLRVEVTSHHVAELAAELCGPHFARTTGAQIPVDGGNERVI
ncbi:MAG TPA: bifunctional aldolase/short-chain dehydrogenase [Acidobacteria bacterium]|nr:bifunctional aldolase/short-chain dehydrogenase [Acidobacteriota bacterium]